jgi:transposase-like protein
MKRKVNRIPDELAIKIATEYLTTDASIKELKQKYNFGGHSNIRRWIRKFGLSEPSEQDMKVNKAQQKEKQRSKRELELEAKLELMQKELEEEKLRRRAYEKLIEIAEESYKISIRKKSGTKQ